MYDWQDKIRRCSKTGIRPLLHIPKNGVDKYFIIDPRCSVDQAYEAEHAYQAINAWNEQQVNNVS